MPIYTKILNRPIVYWPPGPVSDGGVATAGTPIQLKGRIGSTKGLNTTQDVERNDVRGSYLLSEAVVAGGYIWEGKLEDAPSNPLMDKSVHKIAAYKESRNLKGTKVIIRRATV
jgi:hypothetical protein